MEHRQLKYFIKIYQCGSFTAAAKELGISQSALSHSIKELENTLVAKVFLRGSSRISLTTAGEKLMGYAVAILQQQAKALAAISDIQTQQSKSIEIGINSAFSRRFLDAVLEAFFERAPGVVAKISFSAHPLDTVVKNLEHNIWDVAISIDPEKTLSTSKPDISCETITTPSSQIYASKGHPIHQIDTVTLEDLKRFKWAMSTTLGSRLRRAEALQTDSNPRDFPVILYSDSFDLILGAVADMDLLCFAPDRLVEASNLPLIPVKQSIIAPMKSYWKLMYCDDLQLSEPARMFVKCVRQVFNSREV